MNEAAKIVSASLVGKDFKTIFVNDKAYTITPPTIKKIAGAGYYLTDLTNSGTLYDVLMSFKDVEKAAYALSWFIQGNEKLAKALMKGTMEEIVEGIAVAVSMISAENFCRLSVLAKNVAELTAKQK